MLGLLGVVMNILAATILDQITDCCCSFAKSCPMLCDPMDCSMPGFPVLHHVLEFAQTYIHWVGDAIQPSYLPSSHSPPAFNLSQHQGLFKWVSSSHQVAKGLEFQLQLSPSNEYSGLISFRIYWFISLQSKGLSRIFSNTTVQITVSIYWNTLLIRSELLSIA